MESKARLCGPFVNREGPFQLHKLFEDLVISDKDSVSSKPAVFSDGSWTTFLELYQTSKALSQRLVNFARENKFQANDDGDCIIAVCMEHSLELIVSLLAVFQSGAAYLPLDLKFPPGRVQHILRDSRPIFCLTRRISAEFEAILRAECPVLDYDDVSGIPGEDCLVPGSIHDDPKLLAAVLYTSGSTGIPKGVRLEHKTIIHRLNWQWRTFPFVPGEVACFKTALTFVDSIAEVWAPLLQGVPVVIVRKEQTQNTEELVQLLEDSRISRLVLVPSLLQAIIYDWKRREGKILEHLKTWM